MGYSCRKIGSHFHPSGDWTTPFQTWILVNKYFLNCHFAKKNQDRMVFLNSVTLSYMFVSWARMCTVAFFSVCSCRNVHDAHIFFVLYSSKLSVILIVVIVQLLFIIQMLILFVLFCIVSNIALMFFINSCFTTYYCLLHLFLLSIVCAHKTNDPISAFAFWCMSLPPYPPAPSIHACNMQSYPARAPSYSRQPTFPPSKRSKFWDPLNWFLGSKVSCSESFMSWWT